VIEERDRKIGSWRRLWLERRRSGKRDAKLKEVKTKLTRKFENRQPLGLQGSRDVE